MAINAMDSMRQTHIEIADDESVDIATDYAVLPNDWGEAWVKRWRSVYMKCRCQGRDEQANSEFVAI